MPPDEHARNIRRLSISVVVPTKDRPELLKKCLALVIAATDDGDEIIVVDSASVSPRLRPIAERFGARYVRCDHRGASLARNAGWRAAANDVVAFVDDDVRVDAGWADAIGHAFADDEIDFLTGRIAVADDQNAGYSAPVKLETEDAWLDPESDDVIGHSANIAVRRQALEKIGGFDELLGAGGRFKAAEDLDLFDRLFTAGFRGRYVASASALHEQWRDRTDSLGIEWSYGFGLGARLAKLLKTDRTTARRVVRTSVVQNGLGAIVQRARARRPFGVLAMILRLAGTIAGFAAALPRRIVDGHLA